VDVAAETSVYHQAVTVPQQGYVPVETRVIAKLKSNLWHCYRLSFEQISFYLGMSKHQSTND